MKALTLRVQSIAPAKQMGVVLLLLSGTLHAAAAFDPLERVEQDQAGGLHSSRDIFNRNIAIDSMRNYTHVSSYKPGAFGWYAHDGDVQTAWILTNRQDEAFLELSWGLPVPIDMVSIVELNSTGIQALTLELFDGEAWEAIEPHDPARRNEFSFASRPASALRVRLKTRDEETGIAEVEVYNLQSAAPLPRYGPTELVTAMRSAAAVILFDGSPYAYSRSGRTLIKPRAPEACLADVWLQPVIEFICTGLGGKAETGEVETLTISLNGQAFTLDAGPEARVVEQVKSLADRAGLEYMQQDSLVMVGQGLDALNSDAVVSALNDLLGHNPYLVSGKQGVKADALVTPTMNREGITYQWAGFRSTADADTNIDAWLKYSETKSVRSWVNAPRYMTMYVRPEKQIENTEEFEACRSRVRAAPETNGVVAFKAFLNKYHKQLSAEFGIYNALGIDVINATGPKDWPDTLHDDFIQWASTYTLTYYLARYYGVTAHQYGNEPDWYFNQSTEEQIARRLTLVADAVHAAIEDANRDGAKALQARYAAPVLAGDFQGRSARVMMRNLHTRYDGTTSPTQLFQLFNRHRYSGRPHQNALEVRQAKQMMADEGGTVLPQVFTELNYSTGRNWRNPETTFLNDTPTVFASIAGIWGWMMQEQGVYGIFVFKLNDPGSWSWNGTGPFANVITYSMYPEQDPGSVPRAKEQISYGSKNFEVCRLFGRGFHGRRPMLQTELQCSDPQYRVWTSHDEELERFYLWSVQPNDHASYEVEFDLGRLGLPPDALVTAETVSGARHGEVTHMISLPEDGKFRLHQAPESAVLLTAHKRPVTREILYADADAMVVQGASSAINYGDEKTLGVGRHSSNNSNQVSYLKFRLPESEDSVQRAVLELHGQSVSARAYDGGFLFRVYAIGKNGWSEQEITAENAPNLCRTVSALRMIDADHFPVGHVTCFRTPSRLMVDVTRAVQEARAAGRRELNLVLVREVYWPGEDTDSVSARLSSREAGPEHAPKVHLWR